MSSTAVNVSILTRAISVVPGPEESAGLLVFSFCLAVVVTVIREGVDALVAAGVAVCVVDDHIVRGDREVDTQLIARQATLGLGGGGTFHSAEFLLRHFKSPQQITAKR